MPTSLFKCVIMEKNGKEGIQMDQELKDVLRSVLKEELQPIHE